MPASKKKTPELSNNPIGKKIPVKVPNYRRFENSILRKNAQVEFLLGTAKRKDIHPTVIGRVIYALEKIVGKEKAFRHILGRENAETIF